jgi:hypothetical protein
VRWFQEQSDCHSGDGLYILCGLRLDGKLSYLCCVCDRGSFTEAFILILECLFFFCENSLVTALLVISSLRQKRTVSRLRTPTTARAVSVLWKSREDLESTRLYSSICTPVLSIPLVDLSLELNFTWCTSSDPTPRLVMQWSV